MSYLSVKISNNIKKYLFQKTFLQNFPKELFYNIIKYSPKKFIRYTIKKKIEINFKNLYFFINKKRETNSPDTYPQVYSNPFLNAITNQNNNIKNENKEHQIKVLKNGSAKSCGDNEFGQLGIGDEKYSLNFGTVCDNRRKIVKNIKSVTYEDYYSFILLKNGQIMSCGDNQFGQLGLGDFKNRNAFKLIPKIKNVSKIFCHRGKTILLLKSGTIMGCGSNQNGELGLFETENDEFQLIKNVKDVSHVFMIDCFTVLLLSDGSVMSSGWNYYGQLGLGNNINHNKFEFIKDNNGDIIKNVVNVFCDYTSVVLLLKSGEIMVCGSNETGQLGLGHNKSINKFELVPGVNNVVRVFFFEDNGIFLLLKNGKIMISGVRVNEIVNYGELRRNEINGFKDELNVFKLLKNIKNIYNIFPHTNFVIILLKNGKLMFCGDNAQAGILQLSYKFHKSFQLIPQIKNVKNVIYDKVGKITIIVLKNKKILVFGGDAEDRIPVRQAKNLYI